MLSRACILTAWIRGSIQHVATQPIFGKRKRNRENDRYPTVDKNSLSESKKKKSTHKIIF